MMAEGRSFAILGGYGQLGRALARLLVRDAAGAVTIAGRNLDKARRAAAEIATTASSAGIKAQQASADDANVLADLLGRHDVLIHAAPLAGKATEALRTALVQTGGRAVVVSYDAKAVESLRSSQEDLAAAGATVIADAGADPGLPALVGHLAAEARGAADAIEIVARYRAPKVGRAGLADILEGATNAAWVYENGWRRSGLFDLRWKSYPGGVGSSIAMPVRLPELDVLRERHDLDRLALWHGGLNGLTDLVVSLYRLAGTFLPRSIFLSALEFSVSRFSPPPHGIGIGAVATGSGGRSVRVDLAHDDVYAATAEIAALTAAMLAGRSGAARGCIVAFEILVEGDPVDELRSRGLHLELSCEDA